MHCNACLLRRTGSQSECCKLCRNLRISRGQEVGQGAAICEAKIATAELACAADDTEQRALGRRVCWQQIRGSDCYSLGKPCASRRAGLHAHHTAADAGMSCITLVCLYISRLPTFSEMRAYLDHADICACNDAMIEMKVPVSIRLGRILCLC